MQPLIRCRKITLKDSSREGAWPTWDECLFFMDTESSMYLLVTLLGDVQSCLNCLPEFLPNSWLRICFEASLSSCFVQLLSIFLLLGHKFRIFPRTGIRLIFKMDSYRNHQNLLHLSIRIRVAQDDHEFVSRLYSVPRHILVAGSSLQIDSVKLLDTDRCWPACSKNLMRTEPRLSLRFRGMACSKEVMWTEPNDVSSSCVEVSSKDHFLPCRPPGGTRVPGG